MAKTLIQAVTVSVNYADFLQETLPHLMRVVDRAVVVTTPSDAETIRVAEKCGALCHQTESFFAGGAPFRKGLAISEGLAALGPSANDSWLLHIDADIAIFDQIDTDGLHPMVLYGCNRYCVRGRESWQKLLELRSVEMPIAAQDAPFLKPYPRRGRRGGRLLPPGFFQLWHGSSGVSYPSQARDAALDDMTHAQRFPECRVIENLKVYHLESDDHQLKANWRGRATSKF